MPNRHIDPLLCRMTCGSCWMATPSQAEFAASESGHVKLPVGGQLGPG